LQAHGYEVLGVDRVKPESWAGRFLVADMTSPAAIYDVLRGADAAIHLAAVPGPLSEPQSATFENNVLSTYHVAEAAAALALKRLVWASSVFTLGWIEAPDRYWPEYVPVDEEHPLSPFEAYGLSKVVGEEIMAAVSRRTELPIVSLRIMNVIQPGGYAAFPWPQPTRECGLRFVMWPYVDAHDAARSCRLALEANTTGHEAMFIAAADNRFDADTRKLLGELAPQVEIRGPLAGRSSVISIEKAKRLIGYEPEHGWQNPPPQSY
jgi:nucleoside-diphosphate-sugar epimerase